MTKARWTSRLPQLAASLRYAADRGAQQAGVAIVNDAVRRVPVDTSSLQRTIHLDGPIRGLDIRYSVIAGDFSAQRLGYDYPVYYAAYVEYLNTPYLTPAAAGVNLADYVKQALGDYWR